MTAEIALRLIFMSRLHRRHRSSELLQFLRTIEAERLFRRLEGFRRISSRFDKLDVMSVGFIDFALIADGLRLC